MMTWWKYVYQYLSGIEISYGLHELQQFQALAIICNHYIDRKDQQLKTAWYA